MSNPGGDRDQSQPDNLEQVLRLAVEHIPENADRQPDNNPMSTERREFLKEVMSAVSGPGPVGRIKQILQNISDYLLLPLSEGADKEEVAKGVYMEMEEMIDWCEDIDMACDFHKIGGFSILAPLQDCDDVELRWRCGELIAAICQNNPYCQEKILETDQLDRLMGLIESENEPVIVKIKTIYALSGFIRGNEPGRTKFGEKDGYSLILRTMQTTDHRLRTKATFLLKTLMMDNPALKDVLTSMGFVEQLLSILTHDHGLYHEHVMAALLELVTDNYAAATEASRPELNLSKFISDRMKFLKGKPEFEEELEFAKQIEEIVFNSADQTVDR